MKKLLIILTLIPFYSFSRSTLILDIRSCKDNLFGPTTILKVLKEGKLIYHLSDSAFYSGHIWLKDLDTGLYHIQYRNLFYKDIYDSIQISEARIYKFDICVDRFNNHPKSYHGLVDSILDSHTLIIKATSVHTNQVKTEFRIVQKKGKCMAYLKQKFYIKGEKRPDISKSVILAEAMIDKIRQFEYELDIVAKVEVISSGRTYYSIQLGQAKKKYLVSTGEWAGIYGLIKNIFN